MTGTNARLIDRWFPVAAVDKACRMPAGSGLTEKALFPWFASRPIAQARAAALTALLPDDSTLRSHVEAAVVDGKAGVLAQLSERVISCNNGVPPTVLDPFSGRGIIPLEAARAGARAIGIDLSPVATLAGRLLADYPARDWSTEPPLPFACSNDKHPLRLNAASGGHRLAADVELLLAEVGRRVANRMETYYPRDAHGRFPWGYLWAVTMPCDQCKRTFPLLGSLVLRFPYKRRGDRGQSLHVTTYGDEWHVSVVDGTPSQEPTYTQSIKADGKKKKGKTARCPFCRHPHPVDTVKAKSQAGQFADALLAVCDISPTSERIFREPTDDEMMVATACDRDRDDSAVVDLLALVPDEHIPEGNVHTVMGSGYGCKTFGELMNTRQALSFAATCKAIRDIHNELVQAGISAQYAKALASFLAAALVRRLRRATRGCSIQSKGKLDGSVSNTIFISDLFVDFRTFRFDLGRRP